MLSPGKIAFLEDGPLSPNGGEGATYRFVETARLFSKNGYEVLFINAYRGWSDWRRLAELASEGIRVALVHPDDFYSHADVLRARLKEFSPEFVQTKDPKMIASLIEREVLPPSTNLIFDCHDLHDQTPGADDLWRKELFAALVSDLVVCISPDEANRLTNYCNEDKVVFRPCAIDERLVRKSELRPTRHRLAYVGHLYYGPNEQAARWLCKHVIPLLRAKDQQIQVSFFGHVPPALKAELSSEAAVFHGYVEDVVGAVAQCDAALSVVQEGTGTRVKIIHYAAAATPVVANKLGLQGWPLDCGAVIAEQAEDIARSCAELVGSPEMRLAAGSRLQAYMLRQQGAADIGLRGQGSSTPDRYHQRYLSFLRGANVPVEKNFMSDLAEETQPWLGEMVTKGRFRSMFSENILVGEFLDLTDKSVLRVLEDREAGAGAMRVGSI